MTLKMSTVSTIIALPVLIALVGCGSNATTTNAPENEPAENGAVEVASEESHDHGGWWCTEHGIPEEKCSMCSSAMAAEFQRDGDWCDEHNRADSQCFHCHPERQAQFAAKYEAKFGEQPPEPIE